MNNTVVKTEKRSGQPAANTAEERDLDEWARKLAARPAPQIGVVPGQQQQATTLNNYFNLQNNVAGQIGQDGLPHHNGYDMESAVGRFTWTTIHEDKYVPCIFRCKEMFCAVRMAEISVIGEFLRLLPLELYECVNLKSYSLTPVEVKLLNHINSWHCDGFYGNEAFALKDQIISMEDIEKFHIFLSFAYSVLSSGGRNDARNYSKCAFIRVNADNLIPYTVLENGEKGVPLFYFEGQTDILREKAVPLSGWDLAYLKICCKVQGVRKDLISGNTLQIVKMSDLRSYFPKRTVFTEDCWPEPKLKSLLSKNNGTVAGGPPNPLPQSDKWAINITYKNAAAPSSNTPIGTSSSSATSTLNSVSISNTTSASVPVICVGKNGSNTLNSIAVRVANGAPVIPPQLQAKSEALKKIKVPHPPQETSKLLPIPEFSDPQNREAPYVVRLIIIDKELMHCINMHPFRNDTYLVVLQEFMKQFFPSISIYPTAVSVLKSCNVPTYLPNQSQIRALNHFGFCIQQSWQMPLIQAVGVTQSMNKLRTVFRPRESAAVTLASASQTNHNKSNGYVMHSTAR